MIQELVINVNLLDCEGTAGDASSRPNLAAHIPYATYGEPVYDALGDEPSGEKCDARRVNDSVMTHSCQTRIQCRHKAESDADKSPSLVKR